MTSRSQSPIHGGIAVVPYEAVAAGTGVVAEADPAGTGEYLRAAERAGVAGPQHAGDELRHGLAVGWFGGLEGDREHLDQLRPRQAGAARQLRDSLRGRAERSRRGVGQVHHPERTRGTHGLPRRGLQPARVGQHAARGRRVSGQQLRP
jgi:hypothetical protein